MPRRVSIAVHAALLPAGAALAWGSAPARADTPAEETREAKPGLHDDDLSDAEILIRARSIMEQDEARLRGSRGSAAGTGTRSSRWAPDRRAPFG